MKKLINGLMVAGAVMVSACQTGEKPDDKEGPVIGRHQVKTENGLLTPEILLSFGRLGGVEVSPDKKQILYGVSYISVPENKSNREIMVMDADGGNKRQLTRTAVSERDAIWIAGGKEIAFLSSESGTSQVWKMNADGSNRHQLTDYPGGINGFRFSPDGKKILFISNIKYGQRTSDIYSDLPKATGRVVSNLMYKHWDEWVESIPHPFIADVTKEKITTATDIMAGEPYESPMKPFGGMDDVVWTPDGKNIAYVSRKKEGKEYAVSTNSDIYLYNLETGKTVRNLTEGMMGYDTYPRFSPDGRYMAWLSMERDGYESDKNRLFLLDMQTGVKRDLTKDFDYSANMLCWNESGSLIYFLTYYQGTEQIFSLEPVNGKITQLTSGQFDYVYVTPGENELIAVRQSMSKPDEIYTVSLDGNEVRELSFENREILDQLTMGKVEERRITTTDNKKMLTWIVYPPHFDPAKKYPAILYCQGGPQSPVSQFWSYRWNLQLMAANGYIVIAPNRRGLYGFGQEWLEQISGDYGGQNMKDYFSATDAMRKESFVDADRLGAVGASYGGFSVYWLAGHHENRFKAFIAHAGIFNLEQQYVETEEMWFANWDLGGSYWDQNNKIAQRTYANSPHKFVENWNTPILVSHGELDYRILASQGMAAFNAAIMRGIPAELMIFPDENHWILQPQNSLLFHRVFLQWLDKWLKPENSQDNNR